MRVAEGSARQTTLFGIPKDRRQLTQPARVDLITINHIKTTTVATQRATPRFVCEPQTFNKGKLSASKVEGDCLTSGMIYLSFRVQTLSIVRLNMERLMCVNAHLQGRGNPMSHTKVQRNDMHKYQKTTTDALSSRKRHARKRSKGQWTFLAELTVESGQEFFF